MRSAWIKNSDEAIKRVMMREVGIESIEELFKDIPPEIRLRRELQVGLRADGEGVSEYEVIKIAKRVGAEIGNYAVPPFAGIEMCYHVVPSVVKELIYRNEFYTAYTPYSPEINQGVLQALFEYQSLMAELYGVDVVNASMYDGTTALAEAVRMALRITRRKRVVVSKGVTPIKRRVLRTWLMGLDVELVEVPLDEQGMTSAERIKKALSRDTAALVIETPNVFGVIETRISELAEEAHRVGSLLIVFANPLLLGIVKPPGDLGADIVVGEGQPLGLGLYYGGSALGILGTKRELQFVRQLPGRLVGMTLTEDKSDVGFALVLQTREQHIRRERATSNITTNSALFAIAAAIYLAWLGSDGLRRLSLSIAARTVYLMNRIRALDKAELLYPKSAHFMKVGVRLSNVDEVIARAREMGVLCGSNLGKYDDELRGIMSICVTEAHSKRDIDTLINVLKKVM